MLRNEHLTGDARMDHLHEEFDELLQQLRACAPENAAHTLGDLISHTRAHFGQEDKWMRDHSFPNGQCHMDEHAQVLASLEQVHERLCADDHRALPRLVQALEDWFPGHVQHLDSALAQWIVQRKWNAQPIMLRRNAAVLEASFEPDQAALSRFGA